MLANSHVHKFLGRDDYLERLGWQVFKIEEKYTSCLKTTPLQSTWLKLTFTSLTPSYGDA